MELGFGSWRAEENLSLYFEGARRVEWVGGGGGMLARQRKMGKGRPLPPTFATLPEQQAEVDVFLQ